MPSARSTTESPVGDDPPTCAIIAIGRELLLGRTLDTNSHWLAGQLTMLGGKLERISVIDDQASTIIAEVQAAWRRRTRFLFTTGGLGPTYDDATLIAVARAVRRPLELNPEALEHVRARYRHLHAAGLLRSGRLTAPRKKMAILPRGGVILANPVGTAPGMHLARRGSHLFCLPGVPAELRGIFTESVLPLLRALLGAHAYHEAEIDSGCNDETVLSGLIEPVRRRYPDIHVKTDATGFEAGGRLRIFLTAHGRDAAALRLRIGAVRRGLLQALRRAGYAAAR